MFDFPPLTTERALGAYVIKVSGCDDSYIIFTSSRTLQTGAEAIQEEAEKTGQVRYCKPTIEVFDVRNLDLSSEYTEDHGILVRAYRAYGLLTKEEEDQYL